MSIVIVGGNECMVREYKSLCKEYNCKAKVYPKMSEGLRNIGNPDLLILCIDVIIDGFRGLSAIMTLIFLFEQPTALRTLPHLAHPIHPSLSRITT